MKNFQALSTALRTERAEALRSAKSNYRYVTDRGGALLATADRQGGQCSPNIAAECPSWDGRKSSIEALVSEVLAKHPHVESVYLEGAYDGADSKADKDDDNYEPRVEEWSVEVWTRSGGYAW